MGRWKTFTSSGISGTARRNAFPVRPQIARRCRKIRDGWRDLTPGPSAALLRLLRKPMACFALSERASAVPARRGERRKFVAALSQSLLAVGGKNNKMGRVRRGRHDPCFTLGESESSESHDELARLVMGTHSVWATVSKGEELSHAYQ